VFPTTLPGRSQAADLAQQGAEQRRENGPEALEVLPGVTAKFEFVRQLPPHSGARCEPVEVRQQGVGKGSEIVENVSRAAVQCREGVQVGRAEDCREPGAVQQVGDSGNGTRSAATMARRPAPVATTARAMMVPRKAVAVRSVLRRARIRLMSSAVVDQPIGSVAVSWIRLSVTKDVALAAMASPCRSSIFVCER
jgi:hypothetical protein